MDLSDLIAFLAMIVSLFTFYWTSVRVKHSLYLVRIDSLSAQIFPEFAIINGGNTDILVTSFLCAFERSDGTGWEAPDNQVFMKGNLSFSIPAGKSHHLSIRFPSNFSRDFVEKGEFKKNGTLELYHRDMLVIVEWVDSHGKEYKAEAKVFNYGFDLSGQMTMSKPVKKWHDLYKKTS